MDTSSDTAKFTLYCSWFCPFAQRAWIAAEHSGVPYRIEEINSYYVDESQPGGFTKKAMKPEKKKQQNPAFVEATPRDLVPAIQVSSQNDKNDLLLRDSLPVAEYIDAVFGGGKLMPPYNPCKAAKQQI
jgi:glutathione S-transferase